MGTKVKEIEITFGQKRPVGRFKTELISVSLRAGVDVSSDEELKHEVHRAFLKARGFVETEKLTTDRFGISGPAAR